MKNNQQLSLLMNMRFFPLFITQFLGSFNDNVFKNALVILITYRLAAAAGADPRVLVTEAMGIFTLPFFLFSATAGQLADKYEKSRLISIIKFFEIAVMLIAVLAFFLQSIFMLMSVLFLLGVQATFFCPLKYAVLPDHLKENELIAGNGLIEASTFIAILIGTILGGLLILTTMGVYVISATIVLAAIVGWLASLAITRTQYHNKDIKINYNFIQESYRVTRYTKARWDIHLIILGISWFWLVGTVFMAEFPVFAKRILHSNDDVVTYFFSLFAIGLAIGSLLCNKLLKGKVHANYVPIGALGITVFTIDLYFAAAYVHGLSVNGLFNLTQFLHTFSGWHITADLLLIAICGGLYTVPLYAILQVRSEKQHRARIFSSNNIMNALFMVIASAGVMLLLQFRFNINQVFLTLAILNGFVAVYICKLLPGVSVKSVLQVLQRLWARTINYKS